MKSELAFSLIELMVVIGILSVLSALSIAGQRRFTYKAIQTEAIQNIRTLTTLVHSFETEKDRNFIPHSGDCGNGFQWLTDSHEGCQLFGATADPSNCNTTNALGWKYSDCQKMRYEWHIITYPPSGAANWRTMAYLRPNMFAGNERGADGWLTNSCNKLCQSKKIINLQTMESAWILDSATCTGTANLVDFLTCR